MDFAPVGELLSPTERTVSLALNRTDTASVKIRVDDPLADLAQSLDCYLKLYRGDDLIFFGLMITSQETAGSDDSVGHIVCNAAGPSWGLSKRFPVKAALPVSYTGTRANIMAQLITFLDTQYTATSGTATPEARKSRGETCIGWDLTPSAGGTITYAAPPYKAMSDIVTELSNSTDGFDWRIVARENWINGALVDDKIGTLLVDSPMSVDNSAFAVFEFGSGRVNVNGYTRTRSRDTQANGVTHLLNGQPEASPAFASVISDATQASAGVMEDVVQADLTDTTLRNDLVSEHLDVRTLPRNVIQFTPAGNYGDDRLPAYGTEYNIGDTVTGRATVNGNVRFSGVFRVWGVTFTVNEVGIETPTLLLQEQA